MNNQTVIRRGDIWMCELSSSQNKNMLKGLHPVIVYSNFRCLKYSPVVQVVPISSKPKSQPFHIELQGCGLQKRSIILVEQITSVEKINLKYQIGKVNLDIINNLDTAIQSQLGMSNTYTIDMFQEVKRMLDEIEELDGYLQSEYDSEVYAERELALKCLETYCINHSIRINLNDYIKRKEGKVNAAV